MQGVTYSSTWRVSIVRSASYNPFDESGLQDGWTVIPKASAIILASGEKYMIDLECSAPEPREVLGIQPFQANPVPKMTLDVEPLRAGHPISMTVPVYPVAAYQDGLNHSCSEFTRLWADVTYSVEQGYVGPDERDRLSWYDRIGERTLGFQHLSPVDPDGVFSAMAIASHQNRFDVAERIATEAEAQNWGGDMGWMLVSWRGALRMKLERFDDAIADYQRLLVICPSDIDALMNLAEAHHRAHRDADALPFIEQAIGRYPRNAQSYNLRGMINEGLGHRAAAISDYREAIDLGMDDSEARLARESLSRLGEAP
jgi:tetratricopeptide (TPR) repeat protein